MPTFRFKTDAGDGLDVTTEKLEFPHRRAATDDAQVALVEMAHETLPMEHAAHFAVEIEDETGKPVYKASLDFAGQNEDDLDNQGKPASPANRS